MSGAPPYYRLTVASHDVASEIRVNDIPVLRLNGGHVETSFDVNPSMCSGVNTLSLRISAAGAEPDGEAAGEAGEGSKGFSPASMCTVELGVQASPDDELAQLAELRFTAPEGAVTGFEDSPGFEGEEPPRVDVGALVATQTFEHEAPFEPWSWAEAPQIPSTEVVRADVLATYRRLHGLLVSRNIATLLQACEAQARDWQSAYGLPDLAAAQRMLGIAETLSDPAVNVEDFPPDVLTMELLGGGRLVQLVDAEGKSPLRLTMASNSGMVGRFNVVLYRSGSIWMVAR